MKRRGKGLVALSLSILLCLSLAVPALAAEEDFVIEDGNLKEYHGPGGKVVIPDGVRWVGNGAFAWRDDITDVVLPEGIIAIGDCAFFNCDALTQVTIPESVVAIGSCAFYSCTNLERVTCLSDGMTHCLDIHDAAFARCFSLREVTIPSTGPTIMPGAFSDSPWQAEQDRHKPLPIETVRAIVCVAVVAAAAALMVANNKRKPK